MEQQVIKDKFGNILFRVEKHGNELRVKDRFGNILGFCRNGRTYNAHGEMVAQGVTPGLLYKN